MHQTTTCTQKFEIHGTPLWLSLAANLTGLTQCHLLQEDETSRAVATAPDGPVLSGATDALLAYFAAKSPRQAGQALDRVPLDPAGTPFQRAVWGAARSIAPGTVRSYGWLARHIGNPGGMRAVAQALGANPLLLFVPCHRVVRSDGSLGGFSCGLPWKVHLLVHEGLPASTGRPLPLDS